MDRRQVLKGGIVAGAAIAGAYAPPSIRELHIPRVAMAMSPWSTPPLPFPGPVPPALPPSDTPVLDASITCAPLVDGIPRAYIVVRVAGITEPCEAFVYPEGPGLGIIQPGGSLIVAVWIEYNGQNRGSGPTKEGNRLVTPGQHAIRLRRVSDNVVIAEIPFVVPVC